MNWFNGLSLQWKIVVIIVILLIIYFLYRKYSYKLKNLFQAKDVTPQTIVLQNGQTVTVSNFNDLPQSQKTYLEGIAGTLKKDIYGLNVGGVRNTAIYKEAAGLSDVEVDYVADYYKRYLTNGTSLYEDMSSEYYSLFQDNSGFKDLLLKLEKTGNR